MPLVAFIDHLRLDDMPVSNLGELFSPQSSESSAKIQQVFFSGNRLTFFLAYWDYWKKQRRVNALSCAVENESTRHCSDLDAFSCLLSELFRCYYVLV